jgi:hypothetical protein
LSDDFIGGDAAMFSWKCLARSVVLVPALCVAARAGYETIDAPWATSRTFASGVGGNIIVGSAGNSSTVGFIYEDSTWTPLTVPWPEASATCISGTDGTCIVGTYVVDHRARGFLFDGSIWTRVDVPGNTSTEPRDVDKGTIVGLFTSYRTHGFAYDGTTWRTLDAPGSVETWACGIDEGRIVGNYSDADERHHGYILDGSTWTTLDVPGARETYAFGIDGENIVGVYHDGSYLWHGYLYDGETWTYLDVPGALYTQAAGIEGDRVVGNFHDMQSGYHGFIYTAPCQVPMPGSLLMGCLGVGILAWRRGRSTGDQ